MVTRYWLERDARVWEWLRPASEMAVTQRDGYEAAAFPLVPFSNRIRGGRFRFDGRDVALPLNRPPERHAIHGQGWQTAWTPREVSATSALLEFRHAPGAWPWAYRTTQRFVLSPAGLTVELALHNESDAPMPAGLGWHPYFLRTPHTTLTASVERIWLTDAEMLPAELAPSPVTARLAAGVTIDSVALDNGFTAWNRRAVIDWPELGARLVMTAGPLLDFLTVFIPPSAPVLLRRAGQSRDRCGESHRGSVGGRPAITRAGGDAAGDHHAHARAHRLTRAAVMASDRERCSTWR